MHCVKKLEMPEVVFPRISSPQSAWMVFVGKFIGGIATMAMKGCGEHLGRFENHFLQTLVIKHLGAFFLIWGYNKNIHGRSPTRVDIPLSAFY
jgi:putative Ca2+/H+ antiporter (TMEM165/GDT1 family)